MGSLPEIMQYGTYYLPSNVFTASKGSNFNILLVITAVSVEPYGSHTKSSRLLSIVQIIFP